MRYVVGPEGHALALAGPVRFGGQKNEGNRLSNDRFPQGTENVITVSVGHHNVADNQIRQGLFRQLNPRLSIGSG